METVHLLEWPIPAISCNTIFLFLFLLLGICNFYRCVRVLMSSNWLSVSFSIIVTDNSASNDLRKATVAFDFELDERENVLNKDWRCLFVTFHSTVSKSLVKSSAKSPSLSSDDMFLLYFLQHNHYYYIITVIWITGNSECPGLHVLFIQYMWSISEQMQLQYLYKTLHDHNNMLTNESWLMLMTDYCVFICK